MLVYVVYSNAAAGWSNRSMQPFSIKTNAGIVLFVWHETQQIIGIYRWPSRPVIMRPLVNIEVSNTDIGASK